MYRVMVVDDEPIIFESLRTFPWADFDCTVVCYAESGQKALQELPGAMPDIVISDIRMSGLDGLSLSSKIKESFPETEIILLTGYAEFDYARKAIKIGVRQYLLKPFRFEDLKIALNSCLMILEEKERQKKDQIQIKEKFDTIAPLFVEKSYQELLDGTIDRTSPRFTVLDSTERQYCCFCVHYQGEYRSLYTLLENFSKDLEAEFHIVQSVDILTCVLCFPPDFEYTDYEQSMIFLCNMIQKAVADETGDILSFGISTVSGDLGKLKELKKQAISTLNKLYASSETGISVYQEAMDKKEHSGVNLDQYEKRLQKCIVQNTEEELERVWGEFINDLIRNAQGDSIYIKKTIINLVMLIDRFLGSDNSRYSIGNEEIAKLLKYEYIESLSNSAYDLLKSLLTKEAMPLSHGIAERVVTYIEQHLDQDITLNILSQNLYYSTAYLSRVIKKSTGHTFTELLSELRYKKASELLQYSEIKISDIAKRTGYHDLSYFIATFKKRSGVTPKEWRSLTKLSAIQDGVAGNWGWTSENDMSSPRIGQDRKR